jgi:hypothetical protein
MMEGGNVAGLRSVESESVINEYWRVVDSKDTIWQYRSQPFEKSSSTTYGNALQPPSLNCAQSIDRTSRVLSFPSPLTNKVIPFCLDEEGTQQPPCAFRALLSSNGIGASFSGL